MKTNSELTQENLNTMPSARFVAFCLLAGVLLLMALGLTGCNQTSQSSVNTGPIAETQIAGDYALISVDGKAVPCVLSHEGQDVTVKSGKFTINADGTCQSLSTFSVPSHSDVNRVVEATYTRSGAELTMTWKGAGMTKGTISGDSFTMNNEGMIFVYRK